MLDMYGQPHQTQPQPAHSSLSQQYHFQQQSSASSSSSNKKLKLDHVLSHQQQAVDLCSFSASIQQQLGPSDSISLYEVSSTTGCGSGASGHSRGSHGVSNQGHNHSTTGYALTVIPFTFFF